MTPLVIDRVELELLVAEYLTTLRSTHAVTTINRKLACFRKYFRWAGYKDFLAHYKKLPTPMAVAHPIPEGVSGILEMHRVARRNHHKALIVLTGLLGLRVHEALIIRPSHIYEHSDPIELKFQGKGSKVRVVPIADNVYQMLLPRLVECWRDDSCLVPLSDRQARRAVKAIGLKALGRDVATHDMRMTFGTVAYYHSGGDIRAVQELLGHSDINTTQIYTLASMDAMKKAAAIVPITE